MKRMMLIVMVTGVILICTPTVVNACGLLDIDCHFGWTERRREIEQQETERARIEADNAARIAEIERQAQDDVMRARIDIQNAVVNGQVIREQAKALADVRIAEIMALSTVKIEELRTNAVIVEKRADVILTEKTNDRINSFLFLLVLGAIAYFARGKRAAQRFFGQTGQVNRVSTSVVRWRVLE